MNIINNKLTHFIAGVLVGTGNALLLNSISKSQGQIEVVEGDMIEFHNEKNRGPLLKVPFPKKTCKTPVDVDILVEMENMINQKGFLKHEQYGRKGTLHTVTIKIYNNDTEISTLAAAPTKKEARRVAVKELLPTLREMTKHAETQPTFIDRKELMNLIC